MVKCQTVIPIVIISLPISFHAPSLIFITFYRFRGFRSRGSTEGEAERRRFEVLIRDHREWTGIRSETVLAGANHLEGVQTPTSFQIPVDGQKLTVPKAFYHYTENEMSAGASFGLPDEHRLLDTDGLFVNNRKEINGIYLPIPNMEPINLHFVNQK